MMKDLNHGRHGIRKHGKDIRGDLNSSVWTKDVPYHLIGRRGRGPGIAERPAGTHTYYGFVFLIF